MGRLPTAQRGSRHMLVDSDYFYKVGKSHTLPDKKATITAESLINSVFFRRNTGGGLTVNKAQISTAMRRVLN